MNALCECGMVFFFVYLASNFESRGQVNFWRIPKSRRILSEIIFPDMLRASYR